MFSKDPANEGCWVVTDAVVKTENNTNEESYPALTSQYEPQADCIARAIIENQAPCSEDQINSYLLENWVRPSTMTNDEVKESARITLKTNPIFKRDTTDPSLYTVIDQKILGPFNKRRRRDYEGSAIAEEEEEGAGPPVGYICQCGSSTPGKGPTCKWRKGSQGEYLCNGCGIREKKQNLRENSVVNLSTSDKNTSSPSNSLSSFSPPHSTSISTSNSSTSSPSVPHVPQQSNGGLSPPSQRKNQLQQQQQNSKTEDHWIRCDICHRWVSAKSDNIHDISIYDDSNPDHLDYFCPNCRSKDPDCLSPPRNVIYETYNVQHTNSSVSSSASPTFPARKSNISRKKVLKKVLNTV
eukprot:TRINITY_DN4143_c0_g1_i2.p1 TRINITY_DN4143_c0_g1~~TRINITY_DN4143_c0_g1_i2.p1  ORF type:complete len:354 (+),score=48.29 TRINITY_DN4143_c0_g1_i2:519-1580(+)